MTSVYDNRKLYYVLAAVSLIMGIIFFVTNHLDFIIAAVKNDRMNVSNCAYILLRIVSSLAIPTALIVPSLFEYGRVQLLKLGYIIWGAMYILTVFWVIPYLLGSEYQSMVEYQRKEFCVASVVFWDTYHIVASFFSIVFGGVLIYTGISFDDTRAKVRRNVIIVFILRIALPIIYNLISNGQVLSLFWLTNNYADILSLIFLTATILLVSTSNRSWIEMIWDDRRMLSSSVGDRENYPY